jgi:hypothetical protein
MWLYKRKTKIQKIKNTRSVQLKAGFDKNRKNQSFPAIPAFFPDSGSLTDQTPA